MEIKKFFPIEKQSPIAACRVVTQSWRKTIRTFFLTLPLSFSAVVSTQASISEVCDIAAARAAQASNVPVSVLRAITRAETGRDRSGILQPWPWAVNMEGVGKWFKTQAEARSYVDQHLKRGARSFDVGCFQLNFRWHGGRFSSIDEMLDPFVNAQYAADFLRSLFEETGDWSIAAGAYHSRTPRHAIGYSARVEQIHSQLRPMSVARNDDESSRKSTLISRVNAFPLLKSTGATGQYGSLVPLDDVARPALLNFAARRTEQ